MIRDGIESGTESVATSQRAAPIRNSLPNQVLNRAGTATSISALAAAASKAQPNRLEILSWNAGKAEGELKSMRPRPFRIQGPKVSTTQASRNMKQSSNFHVAPMAARFNACSDSCKRKCKCGLVINASYDE